MSHPKEQSKDSAKVRADRMKQYLENKYSKQKKERIEMDDRRRLLEDKMQTMALGEEDKNKYREVFAKAEADAQRDQRKRLTTEDFDPLALIGKGAFGEVRLVRMRERFSKEVNNKKNDNNQNRL